MECGIEFDKIASALERFTGMKRRFQILGDVNNAKIIDDYAHHPTEVQATLKAAKSVVETNQAGRVVAIFQPHRYTRLSTLWNDFIHSFKEADVVYICDVYSAGDMPIEGCSSERLAKEITNNNAYYIAGSMEDVAGLVYDKIKPDDLVLTMGAGDITRLGNLIIEKAQLDRIV
ncbi:MAG: hypothetical protein MZU95_04175 [Desulfomicrobium escambiense]|nr:hypothetical protein [Desulfomicrobium escambiense]